MPILKASQKDLRKNKRRRTRNLRRLIAMRQAVKEAQKQKTRPSDKQTNATLAAAYKAIDKAYRAGMIKKNTAARRKSKLARLLQSK